MSQELKRQSTKESRKENNTSHRKTILKSIRNLFIKASINLSLAASRLKNFAEESLSSDEVINELFLISSSSSISSSLLEDNINNTNTINNNMTVDQPEESNEQTSNELIKFTSTRDTLPTFQEFDAVAEANLLREPGKPFIEGEKIWSKRRSIWLNATSEQKLKAQKKILENGSLNGISKDNYPIIYNTLIEKQKTLKKPMNLKDAIKVINAGWVASKKWERAAQGLA